MTIRPKRKLSVTLDADLVAAIEAEEGETMSARVNAALRADFENRRRQRALAELLAELDAEDGPLDTEADQAAIARYMRLLGGPADLASDTRAAG
jgi:antitoxin CcdA